MNDIILNCVTGDTGQTCTIPASDPIVTPFFSSGEILMSIFLFILILLEMVKLLKAGIGSVKVVREFNGNNSPDGKEKYQI